VVAAAYAAAHPDRVERLVLASTLARFAAEQEAVMEAAMDEKAAEPWYTDAREALEDEQAGRFETDEELGELAIREFPFYFARYGDAERAYLETLRGEVPVADALLLFNNEVFTTFDLRPDLPAITAPTLVITARTTSSPGRSVRPTSRAFAIRRPWCCRAAATSSSSRRLTGFATKWPRS
jgi:pimeloyl-ACP methyl ester carboxylesterase